MIGTFESGTGGERIYEGTSLSVNYFQGGFIWCWYVPRIPQKDYADHAGKNTTILSEFTSRMALISNCPRLPNSISPPTETPDTSTIFNRQTALNKSNILSISVIVISGIHENLKKSLRVRPPSRSSTRPCPSLMLRPKTVPSPNHLFDSSNLGLAKISMDGATSLDPTLSLLPMSVSLFMLETLRSLRPSSPMPMPDLVTGSTSL